MIETLANGYSSESTPRELSNEYQHDWVWMVIKNLCTFVLWMKVASELEGLSTLTSVITRQSAGTIKREEKPKHNSYPVSWKQELESTTWS